MTPTEGTARAFKIQHLAFMASIEGDRKRPIFSGRSNRSVKGAVVEQVYRRKVLKTGKLDGLYSGARVPSTNWRTCSPKSKNSLSASAIFRGEKLVIARPQPSSS